jgi:hypothetical protein
MTPGAATSQIMMTGTETTPLITALQYKDRFGSIGSFGTMVFSVTS